MANDSTDHFSDQSSAHSPHSVRLDFMVDAFRKPIIKYADRNIRTGDTPFV